MPPLVDRDIMERMLSTDPEEEFRQICICIRMGDVSKARKLYRGVSVNQPLSIWDRRTPLHLAISKKDTAMVRFLLQECGANPNDSDDKGRNALHIAVLEGNDEIIQLLIDHGGTDFKAVDKWGQTALHLASLCTNTSAAKLLLGHCMECLEYRQQDGITPLQIATMADNKQIAALFTAAAEHVVETNVKPQVALFEVSQAGHQESLSSPSCRQSPRTAGCALNAPTAQSNHSKVAVSPETANDAGQDERQQEATGSAAVVEYADPSRVESFAGSEETPIASSPQAVQQPERAELDAATVQDKVLQSDSLGQEPDAFHCVSIFPVAFSFPL